VHRVDFRGGGNPIFIGGRGGETFSGGRGALTTPIVHV
jgi:hypothetical protein